jgi:DNA-binding NtrC family response regulator
MSVTPETIATQQSLCLTTVGFSADAGWVRRLSTRANISLKVQPSFDWSRGECSVSGADAGIAILNADLSGINLLSAIAQTKARCALDVIVVTNHSDPVTEVHARLAGILCYLILPGDEDALSQVIDLAVQRHAQKSDACSM